MAGELLMPVTAKLQADVGAFLQTRQRLLAAQYVIPPDEMAGLLANQTALEAQLPAAVQAAGTLESGNLNLSDAATAAMFYTAMQMHMARVNTVLGPGYVTPDVSSVDWSTLLLWGGGAFAAFWFLSKTRHALMYMAMAAGGYYIWRQMGTPIAVGP